LKRKIEKILVLFLAIAILAITVKAAETIRPVKLDNSNREPKMRVRAESLPNDPYWIYQWGPKKIEADRAWNETLGDPSILVAVIDSGIDYTHPDLAANYVGLGYDWVNLDSDPMDDCGHGTRVAGVISAQINNGIGIAGMAQVKIMAEKVLDEHGEGYVDQLVNGIYHATNQGAKIISMSLSTEYDGSLLYDAIKYAYDSGVLLVAAAGNEAGEAKVYPAAYDEVIAVTATDSDDKPAWFTNFGDWVELAAPGVNIYTTIRGGGYDYWSGTSFSCPHVSGLAALIWSKFPNATRDWVRNRLRETADDLGYPGFDIYYGYGRINAKKAIHGIQTINYTLTIKATEGGTTNPPPGNYTYSAGSIIQVAAIPNTNYTLDCWELNGVNIGRTNPVSLTMDRNYTLQAVFRIGIHDIAIANIKSSKTIVGQGYRLSINVTVANQGDFRETFNVTLYANTTIGIRAVTNLPSKTTLTLTFTWNTSGFAKSNYTISAYAWLVPGETDTLDNTFQDGWVIVAMVGDITGPNNWPDGKVDMRDIGSVARLFGINYPDPIYNPNYDINYDRKIDMKDISLIAKQFGKLA
jgi:hypothetical protein